MRRSLTWLTITIVFSLALACAISASVFSSPAVSVTVGLVFFSIPVFLSFASYLYGLWMSLVVHETSAAFTIASALVVNYATEGKHKRFIKNAFQRYLNPAVIEQLIQHPERLKLGDERRVFSIFFQIFRDLHLFPRGWIPRSLLHF